MIWEAVSHFLIRVLDGGGVRGYSTLLILNRLMELIKEEEIKQGDGRAKCSFAPNDPPPAEPGAKHEKPSETFYPCHYFDYMFGTSTGGLIAIMLGRLRLSARDALCIYENLAHEVFGKPRVWSMRGPLLWARGKHNHKRLEKAMKNVISSCSTDSNHLTYRVGPGPFNFDPTFNSEPSMCRT